MLSLLLSHSVVSAYSVTPWTVARQAPLSTGFPRQEYWSGVPFPFPGDFSNPGTEPASPEVAGRFFTAELLGKPIQMLTLMHIRLRTKSINLMGSRTDYFCFPLLNHSFHLLLTKVVNILLEFFKIGILCGCKHGWGKDKREAGISW